MAKSTRTKLERKGIVSPLPPVAPRRNLRMDEVAELQEIVRVANARRFEADHIKANTALIPNGQLVADQWEAIARLLENVKQNWIGKKLMECGYEPQTKCNVNLSDGTIMLV